MKIVVTTLLLSMLATLALAQSSTATTRKPPVAALWKQEPNGFRGFTFGSSRSDLGFFLPEQGYFTAKECSSTEKYRGAGSEKCERIENPIGNVGVSFRYYFRDDKLVEINGDFNSENYEALRDIFIAAYGKPHQSQHTVERTAIGATFQNELLGWNGKRVSVFMTKYLSDINDGEFSITLKSEDAELDRVKREANRKAVQSIK
jgi:hypothetical protein